ncbi:flagellar biosynthetic protein FliR [Vogesella sp. LIG4]|uniref:flagellar biosynthetic protein FliR n=1 Tax=Vogesella sp. LIG4 TaxID=1192162 RepID=UPI0008201557|nr:flagellar biosynthetic protein FliR [Vogesella sp. LIG4]SCK17448.1 flagellar biosynthetic protein FliR [Vogesella sp. LIG4]
MEALLLKLPGLLNLVWWPFCRFMAALSMAPLLGDMLVPVRVRLMLSLVLAVIVLPGLHISPVDPFSLHGIAATLEQAIIGSVFGLVFQLTMALPLLLGTLASSQMGLSMAMMNDPVNGSSSDVVSSLLTVLCILVFFAIDGHLVLVNVVYASFRVWPLGHGLDYGVLKLLAYQVGWVFSAALLLALPIIFSTLVVQLGLGFLNRVAPALNLFSLGFSVVTLFGLFMLGLLVRTLPEHYLQFTQHMLGLLDRNLELAHG